MPVLTVTRDSGYADSIRKYRLLIDGIEAVTIKNGQTIELEVSSGEHRVQAKIDWAGSQIIDIDIGEEGKRLFLMSNLRGPRILTALYYTLFDRWNYICIRED